MGVRLTDRVGVFEREAPRDSVLARFGLTGVPRPLEGGQGTSWLVADCVLKPMDLAAEELAWRAEVASRLDDQRFRLPLIHRALDGALEVDGWYAQARVSGRHERRWAEILEAGEAFVDALASEPRPSFLDTRDDAWSIADRVAWEERPADPVGYSALLDRLFAVRRPVWAPSQLIHGDLATNVLFSEDDLPAIIDLSPYWRPAGYQSALIVVDALSWEDADDSLVSLVSHIDSVGQLLVRALIFRVASGRLLSPERATSDEASYAPVVDLVIRLARS